VAADDIFKLKDGCVWTNRLPPTLQRGEQFENPSKGVGHQAHCKHCSNSIGAIYGQPWPGCDPGRELPCAKLTHIRERKRDGVLLNSVVLRGNSRAEVELALSQQELSDVGQGIGVRTTQASWELTQQLKKVEQKARQREDEMEERQAELAAKLEQLELAGGGAAAPTPAPTATAGIGSIKPWTLRPKELPDGGGMYVITRESLSSGEDTREQQEFNFAQGQVARLHVHDGGVRVQRVYVFDVPLMSAVFASKKDAMPDGGGREIWVFHGTNKANIVPIMTGGFKVGGEEGHEVANGVAFGRGVYTAVGPGTPMRYSGEDRCIILAKALEGTRGLQGSGDSWAPRDDWLVFKSAEQVWPKYVVEL
jgi:hypothetical protein